MRRDIGHRIQDIGLVLGLICIMLASCKQETKQVEREAIPVKINVIATNTSASTRTYIGKAEPSATVVVSVAVSGEIQEIYVRQGQTVSEGQPLLLLDTTQLAAALHTATVLLAQAEDAYQRAIPVHEAGGMSELQWTEVLTQVEKMRSLQIAARKELDHCLLIAPQAGRVNDFKCSRGERVVMNQNILNLQQTNGLHIPFQVAETEIAKIDIGDEALVIVPALHNLQLHGKVIEKDFTANMMSHSYEVTVAVPSNPNVLPGMLCKVRIEDEEDESIIIPQRMVHTRTSGQCVWIIKNGKAVRRNVVVGDYTRNGIAITGGLNVGDTLITSGTEKLYTGATVVISD